jgi:hypothetical protein
LPVVLLAVLLAGSAIELIFYTHYAAPFTAVLLVLLMESLRRLWLWLARRVHGGRRAAQFIVFVLCGSLLGGELASNAFHVFTHSTPDEIQPVNANRTAIEKGLLASGPGEHVIFVRYTGTQSPHEEWIYNLSDIDGSRVVWAQDMGAENSKLVQYFKGRKFWLLEPDIDPRNVRPYSEP